MTANHTPASRRSVSEVEYLGGRPTGVRLGFPDLGAADLAALACPSCGTSLSSDRLICLELDVMHQQLARTLTLLDSHKPALVTAAYYLDQHAHLLHDAAAGGVDESVLRDVRKAKVKQISGELMDAYCRSIELLALARR